MAIKELGKPSGAWCPHCRPGQGCATYESRPDECRTFTCDWLTREAFGPEWKPDKSKIVLVSRYNRITAYVDPSVPLAWKKSPYLEKLTAMARAGLSRNFLVYVSVAERYTLLLPDRHEELGHLGSDDEVRLKVVRGLKGLEYQVERRKA
jgi:hypothetical protein